jgi:hypothetical protein
MESSEVENFRNLFYFIHIFILFTFLFYSYCDGCNQLLQCCTGAFLDATIGSSGRMLDLSTLNTMDLSSRDLTDLVSN